MTTTITIGSVTITSPGAWTLTGASTAATLTGSLSNAGTLGVDNAAPSGFFPGDPGGSSLAIGQTLNNSGTVGIGNTGLTTATTVTATGYSNTGTIDLTGSTTAQAALNILGPAPATLGNVNLFGDALLQFASGAVGGIASGTTFSLRNDPTPISLNPGGVVNATFSNAGTLGVDNAAPSGFFPGDPGGSSLAIGQTLNNSGTVGIGNTGLTTATTVTATGYSNTGTIDLTGSTTAQAALNILGPAPATLGNVNLFGDALLQFASGAVGGIASGTTFSLRNDPTPISLNPGGVVNATFSNAGTLGVDNAAPSGFFPGDPGGSSLAIGQTLNNSGTVGIGNTGLTTATTVTATGYSNTGTIDLTGSTTAQAALNILGPAPATLGNVNLFGDALLQFASGAVGGIASGTTFSLRNDPTPISLNPGGVVNATFSNAGTLGVDNAAPSGFFPGDPGGSSLAIGQTLNNSGTVGIGNTGLTTATTVTATGYSNTGTIDLTGSTTAQAALNILGPAPATLGNVNLFGDALLQFASGAVGGIASGTTFSLRNDPTPISLNPGGVVNATFSNAGTLGVDNAAPSGFFPGDPGGSSLAIGQTLNNSGTVGIGNTGLTTATTVTATGYSNTGTIDLTGSTTAQAALNILGPAPATLGNVNLFGDALLQFASGAVGGIASGTTFSLRNDPTPISLNPGGVVNATFSNAGTLGVDNAAPSGFFPGDPGGSSLAIGQTLNNSGTVGIGNTGLTTATTVTATGYSNTGTIDLTGSTTAQAALNILGPAPATLGNVNLFGDALLQFASGAVGGIASGTTFSLRNDPTPISLNPGGVVNATFSNAGTLGVDNAAPSGFFPGDPGGSSLAIGQTLNNSGTVGIGNTGLTTATTVTATGYSNTGTIDLTGSTTAQAALNILGPAPATLGNVNLFGDALLQFASGAVGGIASGTTFSLRNDPTPISLNPGGVVNATFSNAGTLGVDNAAPSGFFPGDPGGSSLAIGQTLNNSGTVGIGNTGLTTATTVTATGYSNTGTIDLTGSTTAQAALNILGPAPATLGNVNLFGDALLQFASGAVGGIASGTTFSLRNDPTPISLNPGGVVNATFSNAGTLGVDNAAPSGFFPGDPGGSSLAIGQTLNNSGTVGIGNTGLTTPTTVTADRADQFGDNWGDRQFEQCRESGQRDGEWGGGEFGDGQYRDAMPAVTVTGVGNAYTQTTGFTNLSGGTLAGPNVNISGGALQGMGTVTGALNISGSGSIQAINLANSSLAAVLTVNGNYAQSGGMFDALLHGTGVQIDKVAVGGGDSVHLTGGNLQVSGVAFALGQMFNDIMTFTPNDLSGTFATLQGGGNGNMVNLGGGLTLEALYNNAAGNISLEVVPTPPGEIWIDATGNWTTDTAKWSQNRAPIPTDDVTIGSTDNGNVTLNNDATINSLTINPSNALTNTSGTTLTVSTTVGNSGSLTLGGNLTATGAVTNNTGATLTMQGGTLSAASLTNAGTTGGFGTINPAIANTGLVQANGGTLTAQGGIQGTGNIAVNPAAALTIGANSTAGTLTQNGTLNLGANNVTVSSDYTNTNFGIGNSFNKLAGVTGTGQIPAAGPTPANMEVITGPDVTGGNTTTPTLGLGILHVGDSTAYQIANEGTTANPSLRGAIQTDVNGGNITGNLLSGIGVTAANFGPLAPGTSTTNYTVTAANPGLLNGQAVHFANDFGNVPEQTMSITGQVNRYAALALEQTGGDGILTGGGMSFNLDFGNVTRGSPTQEALLAILNDNPLADQAFTDLLSTNPSGAAAPFSLAGCSVNDLPGGDSQSCNVLFDTSSLGSFMDSVIFDVESSNASGYDQIIGDVTLNLEGDIVSGSTVPEPGSIAVLAIRSLHVILRRPPGSGGGGDAGPGGCWQAGGSIGSFWRCRGSRWSWLSSICTSCRQTARSRQKSISASNSSTRASNSTALMTP